MTDKLVKYEAREAVNGWQVHRFDDAVAAYVGFAPSEDEADKMVLADVDSRKCTRVIEYDDDGKRIETVQPTR